MVMGAATTMAVIFAPLALAWYYLGWRWSVGIPAVVIAVCGYGMKSFWDFVCVVGSLAAFYLGHPVVGFGLLFLAALPTTGARIEDVGRG
jgi:hypothetical protein